MKTYVLILAIYNGYSAAVTTQEFTSEYNCLGAKSTIDESFKKEGIATRNVFTRCVKK